MIGGDFGGTWGVVRIILGLVFQLGLYFLPSIIAYRRRRENFRKIFYINLFLGITGIGWIVALVQACQKKEGVLPIYFSGDVVNSLIVACHQGGAHEQGAETGNQEEDNVQPREFLCTH